MKTDSVTTKRAQTAFAELGGTGLIFSANYDTRFSKKRDGLGGRAGIGYISSDSESILTVPIQLNYLLGNGNKFFEVGLGATIFSYNDDESDEFLGFDDTDKVLGTLTFGYRYQPVQGFSFRAAITPIFSDDFFLPYFFGVSFGYSF
ncbi:MAG: hypothetical protein EOP46_01405 [Sphingobacteriaceae bacterium]|nr:MAG: hypothetical protein EOP46_01405 [Sphingobacteriaceae bacterium]